jgi:hypothetical protein
MKLLIDFNESKFILKECTRRSGLNTKSWTTVNRDTLGLNLENLCLIFIPDIKLGSFSKSVYYDLFSIMHYSSQGGLLESRDNRRSFLMGQRFELSFSDIKMANKAYGCGDLCANKESLECLNEGYISMNCKCICPYGITGEFCETVDTKQSFKHVLFLIFTRIYFMLSSFN